MKILLVEDDDALRKGLVELLRREHYEVFPVDCVQAARQSLNDAIDLILLDVGLPDGDGVELCRWWRNFGVETPILFLTAKDEEYEIVRGLDAGGNDYVTKPFRMQEFLSRIRALLRRKQGPKTTVSRSGFTLDPDKMQAMKNGVPLALTLTEYRILQALLTTADVVTRENLLELLWDVDARFVDDNTLSVHMSRLREKLGGTFIKTVRGVGYRWQD